MGIRFSRTQENAHIFEDASAPNVTVFRALRLLRVLRLFRLVQYCKGVYRIFSALTRATGQMINITVLLCVFMTVFALLGMQVGNNNSSMPESAHRRLA